MAEGTNRTNSDAVAELAVKAAGKTEHITLVLDDGLKAQVLALPQNLRLESIKKFLDEYRTAPERKKGTAKAGDLVSLIALANRFKDEHSAIFARPGKLATDGDATTAPGCNLRCKSKSGLGRHRAAERREKEAAALEPQKALPLPPAEGGQIMSGAEVDCVNPFHLRNGRHDRATCYTTRTPPGDK